MTPVGRFVNHFGGIADHYASNRPTYPDELFSFLGSLAHGHSLAWDCGAGSGQASVALARVFDRVIATDASQEQVSKGLPHPRVMYRVAPAEQSGIAEHSVDLILVAQALHWFDLDAFYTEASRVLKPGGVLSAVTYGPLTVDDHAVDELIQAFYHDWVGAFWPPDRQHVENNYRDIGFPFPAIAAPSIEMSLHWRVDQLLGYLRSWSATDAYEKAKGENPVDRLIPLLGAINKLGDQTLKVSWPLTVLAGYAPA